MSKAPVIKLPLTLHWQYGGATNIFSAFCSLLSFGFGRRIMPSGRINHELCIFNLHWFRAGRSMNAATSPMLQRCLQTKMTLQELAYKEMDLYSKVIDLYHQPYSSDTENNLSKIYSEYKKIHQSYADLSSFDIEALKRGLFIQWYALSEPSYLTGISDLDENVEAKIINDLNKAVEIKTIDDELIWMLNYYARWDWIFER